MTSVTSHMLLPALSTNTSTMHKGLNSRRYMSRILKARMSKKCNLCDYDNSNKTSIKKHVASKHKKKETKDKSDPKKSNDDDGAEGASDIGRHEDCRARVGNL